MPYELILSIKLKRAGWKVKLQHNERLEQPHVTILRKHMVWRLGLRDLRLLHPGGSLRRIGPVFPIIRDNIDLLIREWNRMYPENPVSSQANDDEESF